MHLNKIKLILGHNWCNCNTRQLQKGMLHAILWVSKVTGTFQGQLETGKDVGCKGKVEMIVKRLSCNDTEVKSEGMKIKLSQITMEKRLNCTSKVKGKQILYHFRVSTQVFYTNEIV